METILEIVQYVRGHLNDGPPAIMKASGEGKKIVGTYCTYMPWELVDAAGAIAASLCAKSDKPIPAHQGELRPCVEGYLPVLPLLRRGHCRDHLRRQEEDV